jgi:glucuronokinase
MGASVGRAFARAALAGNPSDAYGGRTVAVCVAQWSAVARVVPDGADGIDATTAQARALVAAALDRLRRLGHAAPRGSVRVRTTIPRQVGLGGSSAIVLAVLRAGAAAQGAALDAPTLAREALAAELDLGIVAGPQDREVQARQGLLDMDFATGAMRPLAHRLLPPLLVAHRAALGRPSSDAHAELRARMARPDPVALDAMRVLAEHARRAAAAIDAGDRAALAEAFDGTLDQRARIMALDEEEMVGVSIARAHGAAANYAGSGGAVVALADPDDEARLVGAWARAGWRARRVTVATAAAPSPGARSV